MKKVLLTLGAITTITAPIAAVVSCGSKVHARNVQPGAQTGAQQTTPTVTPVYKDQWEIRDVNGSRHVFETNQEAIDYLDSHAAQFYVTKEDYYTEQSTHVQPSMMLVEEPNNSVFDTHGGASLSDLVQIGHMPQIHKIEGKYYATEQQGYNAWSKKGGIKTAATQGTVSLVTSDQQHAIHDFHFTGSTPPSLTEILHNLAWSKTATNNAQGKDEYTLMYKTTTATSYVVTVNTGDPAPAPVTSPQLGMIDITQGHDDILYTIDDYRKEEVIVETFKRVYDQVSAAGAAGVDASTITQTTWGTLNVYFYSDGEYTTKYYKDNQGVIDDYKRNKIALETKAFISKLDSRDKFATLNDVREHFIIKTKVQTN